MTEHRWQEGGNRMTNATVLTCRYMAGRFVQFRSGREEGTRVTTFTTASNCLVLCTQEACRGKGRRRVVTYTAVILRRNMNMSTADAGLVGGDTGSMTGRTVIAVDTEVIKSNSTKGSKVTGIMT